MKSWKVLLVVLVLSSILAPVMASPKIVVNEIMYSPDTSSQGSYLNEWVELYNPNDISVNLSEWRIEDKGGGGYTFPKNAVIPAKGYVVVCRRTNYFWDYYGNSSKYSNSDEVVQNYDYVYGNATFTLSNSGDNITLRDKQGNVVDWVYYNASWGANGNGKTLERIDPLGDSNSSSNWAESEILGGTPTYKNTVYVPFFGNLAIAALLILGVLWLFRRR